MKSYRILILIIGFSLLIISSTLLYYCLRRADNENGFSSASRNLELFIIDTDAGGDDAAALLLALEAKRQLENCSFEVIAVTCTYGNTDVENVAINVLKILTIADRSDIPVYVGAHRPVLKNFTKGNYFGDDGFGDFDFDDEILGHIDRSKHASLAMVDLARKYPGEISVMALGPLTNIALAINLDGNFVANIERFYILGSSVRGLGNVAPNVEFNFSQDPHSNFIVFDRMIGQPALLFPWETNLYAAIPMKWRTKVLSSMGSKIIGYLNKIEQPILRGTVWNVADLMFVACVIWPELITSTSVRNLTPVIDGTAQGSVLIDYTNLTNKSRNAEILETFDVERFKELLLIIFSN